MIKNITEFLVGCFILAGMVALLLLALRVSGISKYSTYNTYQITAKFANIGDLKVRAPVKIAGVRIGEVSHIALDKETFEALVTMIIGKTEDNIPQDSSASILSESLLGSGYIDIAPGFAKDNLKDGSEITDTNPAVILENLIGQAIFKNNGEKTKNKE